jgi:hypothetical protein
MGSALAIAMIEGVASIMTSPATCFPLSNDLVLDKLDIAEDQSKRRSGVFATFCSHSSYPTRCDFVAAFPTRPALIFGLEASNKSAQPSSLNQAHPNRASIFALGFCDEINLGDQHAGSHPDNQHLTH